MQARRPFSSRSLGWKFNVLQLYSLCEMLKMPCLLELVEKFPVEYLSVGKCWFYRIETFHRNMLISLKVSMESRHAGCPGSLHSWSHASPGSPAPRSPGSCSSSFLTPRPGLYLGSGVAGGRQAWRGGHWLSGRLPCSSISLEVFFPLQKYEFFRKNYHQFFPQERNPIF